MRMSTSRSAKQRRATSRPPTLEDVATRAGVSRALVSIVVRGVPGASEATRERVLQIAADLGYRPDSRARLLAGRQSRLIGVTLVLNHPFHADLAEGIYTAAEPLGYEVVLSAVTEQRDSRRAINTLLDYRCAAAILVGAVVREPGLSVLGERLPVVVLGQRARSTAVDVVRMADAKGMRLAVDHLVGLGHREIVHVDGGRGPGSADRRNGYREAMRRHGLADRIRIVAGGQSEEDGADAARELTDSGPPPSAVLTYNDRAAVGLLDVFVRAGIAVPDDTSVVGYDDSQVARLPYLRLTTVSQDAARMAQLAVERAVARLQHEDVAQREVVLTPHLAVRGTTAPPRSH